MTQHEQRYNRREPQHNPHGVNNQPQVSELLSKIIFTSPDMPEEIFSDIAQQAAELVNISGNSGRKKKNTRTQLRRFYDELVMWNDSVQQAEARQEKYAELVPFIKMLKAKVTYAKGREHVDENFERFFSHCVNKIENPATLRHCKLFMEAFMGYYKALEQ